jgi:hypothetical protein
MSLEQPLILVFCHEKVRERKTVKEGENLKRKMVGRNEVSTERKKEKNKRITKSITELGTGPLGSVMIPFIHLSKKKFSKRE